MSTLSSLSLSDNSSLATSRDLVFSVDGILQRIREGQLKDDFCIEQMAAIPEGKSKDHPFHSFKGLLLRRGKVVVPDDIPLQLDIVRSRHDHPTRGHPGRTKTTQHVSAAYWWPKMGSFITDYVKSCAACMRTKTQRHKRYGLLHPLPVAKRPWASVSMDFIEPLPVSNGFDSIIVFVDRFTKMALFVPTSTTITSKDLSHLLLRHVISKHGVLTDLVSDRGAKFTSSFWRSLSEALGIEQSLSTAYHPESDGQTERVNQILEQYLRLYVNYDQSNWNKWLPLAEFAYNNTPHSSTTLSPFYANKGYNPTLEIELEKITDRKYDDSPARLQEIHSLCRDEITAKYKKYANDKRIPFPEIHEGSRVWLSTANLCLACPMLKLAEKRIGPYKVLKKVLRESYCLELPPSLRTIYPVFHVSLLEPERASHIPGRRQDPPPPVEVEDELEWEVEAILDSRKT